MTLTVIVTERLSPGLRGVISKWLIEVNPGTYIGSLSARVRTELWEEVSNWVISNDLGYALLIHPDNTEQGYTMQSWGTSTYQITDHHGLTLINRQHEPSPIRPESDHIDPGW
ncbi:type I-E CRISPR-associated endoribonuclease Cas2e [Leekyejoonella antrihumi]|uniref:Type I-E CRISPR-associated endoribonuclease Cas2 n=1 Tax=Leekyejoonella antrihumi TaxID=1660198 RepID=A0A563DS78_9MICO|nr:type I-E CRISPR-associated endoribonuclease Cas2e [Leekyejoonella antrihumi]TWP32833.1 type I-E CRISPR-associated endoribonuclease Cas2 [Leekyejoonella antrihumi]